MCQDHCKENYCYLFCRLCDCEAIAYPHPNFGGRSLSIRQQNADFRNDLFTNIVDSIKIKGKCRWLFYSSPNFLGETHFLALFNYSSSPSWGGPGDHLSSARVLPPAGTRAIALFDLNYYAGRMLVLYQSCSDLEDFAFNEQVSSYIIIGGSWKLYLDKNFVGNYDSHGVGEYPVSHGAHIRNNTVSSVKLG